MKNKYDFFDVYNRYNNYVGTVKMAVGQQRTLRNKAKTHAEYQQLKQEYLVNRFYKMVISKCSYKDKQLTFKPTISIYLEDDEEYVPTLGLTIKVLNREKLTELLNTNELSKYQLRKLKMCLEVNNWRMFETKCFPNGITTKPTDVLKIIKFYEEDY